MSDFTVDPTLPLTEERTSKFGPNPTACVDVSDQSCETCGDGYCFFFHVTPHPENWCEGWTENLTCETCRHNERATDKCLHPTIGGAKFWPDGTWWSICELDESWCGNWTPKGD